jgi:hypothetical protein
MPVAGYCGQKLVIKGMSCFAVSMQIIAFGIKNIEKPVLKG